MKVVASIRIAEPCTHAWDGMSGSAELRHCEACKSAVHNLAMLTAGEIEALLVETNGEICGRIRTLSDGTIVHRPAASRYGGIAFFALSSLVGLTRFAPAQATIAVAADKSSVQAPLPRTITGTVTDQTGALIVGARVIATRGVEEVASTVTNAIGEYTLSITAGSFVMKVAAPGFVAGVLPIGADMGSGAQNFALKLGAEEEITISSLPGDSSTTMGVLISNISYGPWYKRVGMRLRHPVAYTKYTFRHK